MRESRPFSSWNGWISKKPTFQIAMRMSGCNLSAIRAASTRLRIVPVRDRSTRPRIVPVRDRPRFARLRIVPVRDWRELCLSAIGQPGPELCLSTIRPTNARLRIVPVRDRPWPRLPQQSACHQLPRLDTHAVLDGATQETREFLGCGGMTKFLRGRRGGLASLIRAAVCVVGASGIVGAHDPRVATVEQSIDASRAINVRNRTHISKCNIMHVFVKNCEIASILRLY